MGLEPGGSLPERAAKYHPSTSTVDQSVARVTEYGMQHLSAPPCAVAAYTEISCTVIVKRCRPPVPRRSASTRTRHSTG